MISCTRKIEFDAGHRILKHESKCKFLHGHRYVIEASFVGDGLDSIGRVIDFGVVKELLGDWVDSNWDHTTILCEQDKEIGDAISQATGQKIFYMQSNPTAENMAEYLIATVCPQLFTAEDIKCVKLRLYETPNCYAEVTL